MTLPLTEASKQSEWTTVLAIATNNGYATKTMNNVKKKLQIKQHKLLNRSHDTFITRKKRVIFTYHSPLIRRVTNLFKHTELNIAYKATNTIKQQIAGKQINNDPSGVYKLKCNTCNKVYVGQSGRAITKRYKEHITYIKSNNPISAYATHILQNIHEFGPEKETMHLIKKMPKGFTHVLLGGAVYVHVSQTANTHRRTTGHGK
jgi:hypothetical protein